MATISKAVRPSMEDPICQGNIYKNVKYSYIDSEDDEGVDIIEFEFPLAVLISQACDVIAMEEMIVSKSGKPTKFMPAVLMCPIYKKDTAKNGGHVIEAFNRLSLSMVKDNVFHSDDHKVALRDWHYRFHALEISVDSKTILNDMIVDFKHYFSVPMSYLVKHKEDRILQLDDLYAEQLTLKFSTYLSRVAIPD